jgi:hypothetical protein
MLMFMSRRYIDYVFLLVSNSTIYESRILIMSISVHGCTNFIVVNIL